MAIKATWHVKLTHGVADWARVFPGVNGYTGSYGRGSTRHVFPGVNGYTGSYGRGDRTAAGACLPSRHPRVLLVARRACVPAPPSPTGRATSKTRGCRDGRHEIGRAHV